MPYVVNIEAPAAEGRGFCRLTPAQSVCRQDPPIVSGAKPRGIIRRNIRCSLDTLGTSRLALS
jgi:hypothetical protein